MIARRRALALAERRRQLVARSNQQRVGVATLARSFERPLAWVDGGIQVGRWVWQHPLLLVAPVLLLAVWRPARVLRMGSLALALWRAADFLRAPAPPR
jgi:hypothetical protein